MRVQPSSKNLRQKPRISEIPSDGCYALIVTDPDAPPKQPGKSYLHWLVVNIQMGDLESGRQIVSYQKPTPPPGTGRHRYLFQLYEQPCGLTVGLNAPQSLGGWDLGKFVKEKGLTLREEVVFQVGAQNLNS